MSRGAHGFVYLTLEDRRRLARALGVPTRQFTRQHCVKTDGLFHLLDDGPDCRFLNGRRCAVYDARPTQCRTWPFWPENLSSRRAWVSVKRVTPCPGMDSGPLVPLPVIEATRRHR